LVIDEGIPIGFFGEMFPLGVKWCEGVDRDTQSLSSLLTPAVAEELQTRSKHQYKI